MTNDGPQTTVTVYVTTEDGCDISEGEYSWELAIIEGAGIDDKAWGEIGAEVMEHEDKFAPEGLTVLTMKRNGEWQDVFWCSWFELTSFEAIGCMTEAEYDAFTKDDDDGPFYPDDFHEET